MQRDEVLERLEAPLDLEIVGLFELHHLFEHLASVLRVLHFAVVAFVKGILNLNLYLVAFITAPGFVGIFVAVLVFLVRHVE